ncbi:MAG: phosphoribosylformylglycinamidine cyclo-ligase [Defluviitaleaceae bacterium]|nr:phosphoribosylformylglycinamidine cyclo-ligase [Defluviitaleaceae bacterium]
MATAYKDAGVDIHAGYEAVSRMKKHVDKTMRPGVMGSIGAFGGLFDLSAVSVKEPVLVSGTDSVGSKVKLAIDMDRHDTVGIDVVAMCVNDIITQGAEPIFFLDYIGCGHVDPRHIEQIVKGVSDGCVQAGCGLVGGETAEIAGLYAEDDYDLAGFAVGVVEKSEIITGENIAEGDVIIGLASSGLHSNGYSLVRKIVADNGLDLGKVYDGFSKPLGEVLLAPTRIYVKTIMNILKSGQVKVKGIANITGGGFIENIPRVIPKGKGLGAEIDKSTWEVPTIFNFLQQQGQIPETEMYNVFNMGISMVLMVSPEDAEKTIALAGEGVVMGRVASGFGDKVGERVRFV